MYLTSSHINGCEGAWGAQSEDSYPAREQPRVSEHLLWLTKVATPFKQQGHQPERAGVTPGSPTLTLPVPSIAGKMGT